MGNIFQLKVTLKDVKPSIWRRIQIKDNINFLELSTIIQISMGWTGKYSHVFVIKNEEIGFIDDVCNSKNYRIKKYFYKEGIKFIYEYDFQDGWEHDIELEKILPVEELKTYPICIEGKRNCPPERCGGPWAYEDLIDIIKDKKNPEHKDRIQSLGDFKPEKFDIISVNNKLQNYKTIMKDIGLT
jgi:hypothetical protein